MNLPKIGDKLSNGATMLAIKKSRYDDTFIVLAHVNFGYHPYVTWRLFPKELNCEHGNYFESITPAAIDFGERE
jgi:hypothetical protein